MMMQNNQLRNVIHQERKEDIKVDDVVTEKEIETTHISSESMVELAKMVSSMIESSPTYSEKHLHEKYHELDKRIAICEALIHAK